MDVGARLLGYLHSQETIFSHDYVALGPCFEEIQGHYPELSNEDLEHVVILLATPSQSWMRVPEAPEQIDATREAAALLERPAYESADRARLTRTGRQAIRLASSASSFLLTRFRALEIAGALRDGLFVEAQDALKTVLQKIAELAEDIRNTREQPGRGDRVEMFRSQSEAYNNALSETNAAVVDAQELLGTSEITEAMDRHAGQHGGADAEQFSLELYNALRLLERLGRMYADFIHHITSAGEKPVGVRDLPGLAAYLALCPPDEALVAACHAQSGPLAVCWPHAALADFDGILPAISTETEVAVAPVARPEEGDDRITPMDLFLEAHREHIRQLLFERPIRLSEARTQGWLSAHGQSMVDQLVGVFTAPRRLVEDEAIEMRLVADAMRIPIDGHRALTGDDLELRLRGEDHAAAGPPPDGDNYAVV
ncbi:hypothetical protein J7355_15995 [Endozoicomonas sp. G2_2]|uniref:hypothetical protein n=1 Tax=Gammaproteobacteria TaxID=1236 RepID=UPI001ADAC4B9|nr:hypothetical protein [Endozoicomonas sp. G2_2]MBO9471592.1 hypothetical protein [Endozoicomonas sp. G2_2]